jgi:hypothetical protein
MFKIYNADYLIMPVMEPQIQDLGVPVVILCAWLLFALLAYFSFVTMTWTEDPTQLRIAQGIAISLGIVAGLLTLGLLSRRAGWTKDELDAWGDDMLAGKPPL